MNEDIAIKLIPVTSLKSGRIYYKLKSKHDVQKTIRAEGNYATTLYPSLELDKGHQGQEEQTVMKKNKISCIPRFVPSSGSELNLNQSLCPTIPEVVKKLFNNEIRFSEDEIADSEIGKVLFERGFSRLFFKVMDMVTSKKAGKPCFYVLECYNVSAADLKVTSKFSSWDTLACRLLIECGKPIVVWTKTSTPYSEFGNTNLERITPSALQPCTYSSKQLSGYMVKAMIPLEYVTDVRDMLYSMKLARKQEINKIKELKKQGQLDKKVSTPSKIREGLPEWVNYVPYQWYSSGFRVTLEYILVIYTILSLLWAIWQLYKHVDFIQAYLKPILEVFEYYFFIMKHWFHWLDQVIIAASHYWWSYLKPTFILIFAALAPLAQVFKPLRRLVDVLPVILAPFIQCLLIVYAILKSVVQPLAGAFKIISQVFYQLIAYITQGFNILKNSSAVTVVIERGSQFTIIKAIQSALNGKLDPLKAQFMVVRGLIFQSARKIFFGIRFIMMRIYHMIAFIRRERRHATESIEPKDADNVVDDVVNKAKVD